MDDVDIEHNVIVDTAANDRYTVSSQIAIFDHNKYIKTNQGRMDC